MAQTIPIPGRGGVSPIGTFSPNTGSKANTNSTYAQGAYASGIAEVAATATPTAYTVNDSDYPGVVIFDSSSACTATLNSSVGDNFTCSILNLGTGAITLTPTSPDPSVPTTVNGASSLTMASGQGCTVYFADGNWLAFVGAQIIPVVPNTIAVVAGKYLTGYNSGTGNFSVNSPAGISATITTAALTGGGTQGSQTFVNGLLTAQTPAT